MIEELVQVLQQSVKDITAFVDDEGVVYDSSLKIYNEEKSVWSLTAINYEEVWCDSSQQII